MRPLRLLLQAFGPYHQRTEVDFRPCHSQGLFLIHGPVGSGKTTLLDGICFGLYGVSSGGERSAQQLRSDIAPESLETMIEFDFEAEGAGWRVQRRLGDRPDAVRLFSLVTDSQVSQGQDEVGRNIERLLGLDPTQFRRAVVLPQGQFRQFLLAGSGERDQILAALLHTHSPARSQAALETALSEAEAELARAWQRRQQLQGEGPDLHEELRGLRLHQAERELQLARRQEQNTRLNQDRERVAVVEERSRERQRLQRELAVLEEQAGDLEELARLAERLRAALQVAPQVEQWRQAQTDEAAARENFSKADQELQQRLRSLTPPESSAQRLEQLQSEKLEVQSQLQQLTRSQSEARRLHQGEERLSQCRQTWNQLEEEGQMIRREQATARRRLEQAERSEQEEDQLKARLIQEQKQLERLRENFKNQRQQGDLLQGITRVQQSLVKIGERRNRALQQIERWEHELAERTRQLEQHWSWSLAQRLQPGQPCPVCGSSEHPAPAGVAAQAGQLSLEQLRKQLEQGWKQAEQIEQEEHEQQIQLVRLEERLESAREKSSTAAPASQEEVQQLSESLRDLERQLQRFQHAREHRARDERRLRKLETRLKRWQEASQVARQALDQAEAIVGERRELLALDGAALEGRRTALNTRLLELERAVENQTLQLSQDSHLYASFVAAAEAARQSIDLSEQRTRLAYELVETRLHMGGFADLKEWEDSYKAAGHDLDAIQQELHIHQAQKERLEDESERAERLYHESLEPLGGSLEGDPLQLERELQQAHADVAGGRQQVLQCERRVADYERSLAEIQKLEPQVEQLRRLCRVARGENPAGLSFQQWVLAQQMESVIQSANQRLTQMTRGRFRLETGRSALELQVRDHLSGQARAVTTLSGGESFLASLALALGLSDCFLQSGNRAILETLFIDEGFGYLDEEGLDQAFWALEPIQRDGRVLGIVSHLAEVRQRIPLRLEVRPSPGGNQLVWNTPEPDGADLALLRRSMPT